MSPSRPEYSPNVMSRSASRSRCKITCFAVWAAIRPKSAGVSSHSRSTILSISSPSSFSLISTSCAKTVTAPDSRSISARAWRVSSALVIRRYADARAFSIASTTVSNEMPRSRSSSRSESIGMFKLLPFSVPFEDRPRRPDLVERDVQLPVVRTQPYGRLRRARDDPVDPVAVVDQWSLGLHHDLAADRQREVLRRLELPLEARGRHLERVPARDRIAEVQPPGDLLGHLCDGVEVDPVDRVDEHPHDRPAGTAPYLDVPESKLAPSGDRLGEVSDLLQSAHRPLPQQ